MEQEIQVAFYIEGEVQILLQEQNGIEIALR
jgi:hypothetical protein